MKTEVTAVTDKTGKLVPALLIRCPSCESSLFTIFIIGKNHQHLQCDYCSESFCDESCKKEK